MAGPWILARSSALASRRVAACLAGAQAISFASMDEYWFKEFFDKLLDIVIQKIIPGVNREAFEQQVYEAIGERGPDTGMQ